VSAPHADRALTLAEAAMLAYVSPSTIRRWVAAGALTPVSRSPLRISEAMLMRVVTDPAERARVRRLARRRRPAPDPRQLPLFVV
jgi:predicted site-specific integrase-resolvase